MVITHGGADVKHSPTMTWVHEGAVLAISKKRSRRPSTRVQVGGFRDLTGIVPVVAVLAVMTPHSLRREVRPGSETLPC